MRCAVVGAGIGGLAAAIALRRAGLDAPVFERAPEPREVGAGIVLWGNAVAALRAIGAAEPVLAAGEPMVRGELRAADGRLLSAQRVADWDRELGEPSLVLHRAELLAALLDALPGAPPRFGGECVAVEERAGAVELAFEDGSAERAELLVGADGLRSVARRALFGAEEPRYSGSTCWRAVCEAPDELVPPGFLCETWGRGRRFGWLRLPRDRVYWFATLVAPRGETDPSPEAGLERVRGLFGSWWGPIPALIEATEPARLLRNDLLDRPPRRALGRGRVTLLGDAAHPTTPNVGQGACLALEDAQVLARELARRPGLEGLRAYEDLRRARTAEIVRFSWRLGRVAQWSHPAAAWLRDRALAATPIGAIRRRHRRYVGWRA